MGAIIHREGVADDIPFVCATMLRSLWSSKMRDSGVSGPIFFRSHRDLLGKILSAPTSRLTVACLEDDHAIILGYLLYDVSKSTVHYMYVKGPFQGRHIGRGLIEANISEPDKWALTHMTKDGERLWRRYQATYNPYLLMELSVVQVVQERTRPKLAVV